MLAAGLVTAVLTWPWLRYVCLRVPVWLAAITFGVLFGLGGACGGWIVAAFHWRGHGNPLVAIGGGTLAGALIGLVLWLRDRRRAGAS